MMAQTHTAFAAAITSTTLATMTVFTPISMQMLFVIAVAVNIGAIFPDIDEERSSISRKLPVLSSIVCSLTGHREYTHTVLFPVVFMVAGFVLMMTNHPFLALFLISFGFGWALHILGDMCTVSGVKIFRPFNKKTYYLIPKKFRFKTFSADEFKWLGFSMGVTAISLFLVVFRTTTGGLI